MDVYLNELSLHGQFENLDTFLHESLTTFIRVMKCIEKCNSRLLKTADLWSHMITQKDSLHAVATYNRNCDEVRAFKRAVDRLLKEPFFEVASSEEDSTEFQYGGKSVSGTALEYACRSASKVLASFTPSEFTMSTVDVSHSAFSTTKLTNLTADYHVMDMHWNIGELSLQNYAIFNCSGGKLDFSNVLEKYGFDIIRQEDCPLFLDAFRKFNELEWWQILIDDGFQYKQYHGNLVPGLSQDTYKFRISKKYRCHGYREGYTFRVLAFELDHKFSDKG